VKEEGGKFEEDTKEKMIVVKNENNKQETEVVNEMEELEENEELLRDWLEESI